MYFLCFFWFIVCTSIIFFFRIIRIYVLSLLFLIYSVHINHFFLFYCKNLCTFFVFFLFTVCTSIIFFFSIVRIYILYLFFVYTSIIFFFYKNLCTFFFFFVFVYNMHFRIRICVLFFISLLYFGNGIATNQLQ